MMKMSYEKKILETFDECWLDTYGESSEIYEDTLKDDVLEELGKVAHKVAQQIREKLRGIQQLKTYGNYETRKEEMLLQWVLALLVEEKPKKKMSENLCEKCRWQIIFPKGTYDAVTGKQPRKDEIYCCELNVHFPNDKRPYTFFCASFKETVK